MDSKINVLVTGCGGDIGQSIGKILKEISFVGKVIGTDLDLNHAGVFIYNTLMILPNCKAPTYLDELKKIITEQLIDIVIPISEAEIRFFYSKKISNEQIGAKIIIANRKSLSIGIDKFATSQFLKNNNLRYPETKLIGDVEVPSFPCIVKSRDGSGGKSVFLVKEVSEFKYFARKYPDAIVQEYLEDESEEYTCGIFRSVDGEIRTIIFKRKLMGGFSGYGEVITNNEITALLTVVAQKLDLHGSINAQLRKSKTGYCIFEINPRFSSTVRFRDLFGFKDVLWALEECVGKEITPYQIVKSGKKFYKGFNEYIS
jgi:carbamoyl-phosphate synthase large subunit